MMSCDVTSCSILDDLSVSSPDGNSPSTTASDNVQPPPPELVEAHQELQKSHRLERERERKEITQFNLLCVI